MQNHSLNVQFARLLAAVARVCKRDFSSIRHVTYVNEKDKCPIKHGNVVNSPSATSSSSAPTQHLIQFEVSVKASSRLDLAIVSRFRLPGISERESPKSPSGDMCRAPAERLEAAPCTVPKGRPPRGREGRQQHIAQSKALESLQVPIFSALKQPNSFMTKGSHPNPNPMTNGPLDESRRKRYELRRAERQRLNDAEFDTQDAHAVTGHKSEISDGNVEDFAADDEDLSSTASSFTPSATVSVNCNDFDYHMNVTASLASRQRVSQLIENGMVSVNDSLVISKSHVLAEGLHAVTVSLPFAASNRPVASPASFPFPVLYEDDALLVICKPAGIVVHPTPSVHDAGTPSVVSRLLELGFLLPASQSAIHRAGLVHRLDRDTSGCLLIAKTHLALAALGKQFADRIVTKRYLAVVHGCPGHNVFRQRISSSHHVGSDRRARVAVAADSSQGKSAVTAVSTLTSCRGLSVVEAVIGTGRTHQIRVHLSSAGCPVFGDTLYGGSVIQDAQHCPAPLSASRPMLHAHTLVFKHPVTSKDITVTAPPPDDMLSLLRALAPTIWPPSSLEKCV